MVSGCGSDRRKASSRPLCHTLPFNTHTQFHAALYRISSRRCWVGTGHFLPHTNTKPTQTHSHIRAIAGICTGKHVDACEHTHTGGIMHTYKHVHTCAYTHLHSQTHIHTQHPDICADTCTLLHSHTQTDTDTHTCAHPGTHLCVHMHTHNTWIICFLWNAGG